MAAIKKTVFSILERGAQDSQQNWVSKLINYIILILIFLNVFAVIIQTEKNIAIEYNAFFSTLEYISVTVFSTEYLLRVWVSTEYKAYKQPIWGRLKYMISPMAIIDLFAILPFYLLLITKLDFRFIATFRFFRLLRIFKLKRYSHALNTLCFLSPHAVFLRERDPRTSARSPLHFGAQRQSQEAGKRTPGVRAGARFRRSGQKSGAAVSTTRIIPVVH